MTSTSRFFIPSIWYKAFLMLLLSSTSFFAHAENFRGTAQNIGAAAQLGKVIFLDKNLSSDGTISCASCHDPAHAFTDAKTTSVGVHGQVGTRNALSLLHLTETSLFWDGRGKSLEEVVSQPFTNPVEMGLIGEQDLLNKLSTKSYLAHFHNAFPGENVPTINQVRTALSAYVRSLPIETSAYDRYVQGDHQAISPEALQGLTLFSGVAGCSSCHSLKSSPATLTDNSFHHTTSPPELAERLPVAALAVLNSQEKQTSADQILADRVISELGRFNISRRTPDIGTFRTPSLRNVALTAPYMHDGRVVTLSAAIDHEIYYRSFQNNQRAFMPTIDERKALRAFLESLTDASFVKADRATP